MIRVWLVVLRKTAGPLVEEIEKKAGTDHARDYTYVEDELVGLVDLDEEVGAAPRGRGPGAPLWVFGFVVLGGAGLLVLARRHPREAAAATSAVLLVFTCASGTPTAVVFSWVHTDPLGTPLAVTNTPANPSTTPAVVIWRAKYEPFGKATVNADPDGDGSTFSLNVRFPGQYQDAETGLYYNYLRTYDPSTGRYTESDRVGLRGQQNLYAYADGNPISAIDRKGEIAWIPVIVVGGGALAGGYSEGSKAYKCGSRGLDLAQAILRGAAAGSVGSLGGLLAGLDCVPSCERFRA